MGVPTGRNCRRLGWIAGDWADASEPFDHRQRRSKSSSKLPKRVDYSKIQHRKGGPLSGVAMKVYEMLSPGLSNMEISGRSIRIPSSGGRSDVRP
jgi:hypothetical protein